MKLLSVNVGRPREIEWQGRMLRTGIFKEPVSGPVMMRTLNLDGDGQADLTVHGGVEKAVYAYPVEHYAYWQEQLGVSLPWAKFGENLTVAGLLEQDLCIGDRLRVGAAEVIVTQPRFPCSKLAARFQRPQMVDWFLASRRSGFYVAVAREGLVAAGDTIEVLSRDRNGVSVADFVRVYASDTDDVATMLRLMEVAALPAKWRERFERRLANLPA
jgi:MOSC domain-containing protein YiiM